MSTSNLSTRKPRERDIEWCLRQGIESRGGVAIKLKSTARGMPDRLVLMPGGRVVFVELKTAAGRLSWPQERTIAALRMLGADVFVLRSLDHVVEFLEALDG